MQRRQPHYLVWFQKFLEPSHPQTTRFLAGNFSDCKLIVVMSMMMIMMEMMGLFVKAIVKAFLFYV